MHRFYLNTYLYVSRDEEDADGLTPCLHLENKKVWEGDGKQWQGHPDDEFLWSRPLHLDLDLRLPSNQYQGYGNLRKGYKSQDQGWLKGQRSVSPTGRPLRFLGSKPQHPWSIFLLREFRDSSGIRYQKDGRWWRSHRIQLPHKSLQSLPPAWTHRWRLNECANQPATIFPWF